MNEKNWGKNNDGKQFEFPTPFYLPNYLVVHQSIHLEHIQHYSKLLEPAIGQSAGWSSLQGHFGTELRACFFCSLEYCSAVPEIKARELWNKTFCNFCFLHTYPDLKEFFRLLKGLLSTSLSEFFRLLKGLCCIDTTGLLSTSLSACLRLLGLSKIRLIHGMKCVTLATMYFQKNLRTHIFAF